MATPYQNMDPIALHLMNGGSVADIPYIAAQQQRQAALVKRREEVANTPLKTGGALTYEELPFDPVAEIRQIAQLKGVEPTAIVHPDYWARLNDPEYMKNARVVVGPSSIYVIPGYAIGKDGKPTSYKVRWTPLAVKRNPNGVPIGLDSGYAVNDDPSVMSTAAINGDSVLNNYGIETAAQHRKRDKAEGDWFTPIANFATGGAYSGFKDGDWNAFTKNALNTMTGGISGLAYGIKTGQGFGDITDRAMDPGRTTDAMVRNDGAMFGKTFGDDARGIMGNYVIPAVAGIFGGPVGGAIGAYAGNKFNGGDNNAGLIRAGAAYAGGVAAGAAAPATSALSGAISPYIGTAAGNVIANTATQAAINAGLGAGTAAVTGQNVGDAAAQGAITGAVTGAGRGTVPYLRGGLMDAGFSPTASNQIANAAVGAGTNAITTGIRGGNPYLSLLPGLASAGINAAVDAGKQYYNSNQPVKTVGMQTPQGANMAKTTAYSLMDDGLNYNTSYSSPSYSLLDGGLTYDTNWDLNYPTTTTTTPSTSGGGSWYNSIDWGKLAATVLPAAIGAGASIYGANQQANASQQAAGQLNSALNNQAAMYYQTRADFQPYADIGRRGLIDYENFVSGKMPVQNTPAYQFGKQEIDRNMERRLAATGRSNSTYANDSMSRAYGNLASQEYQNQYSRLLDPIKIGQGAAGSTGQANQNMASAYGNFGTNMANNTNQQGANQASLYSGLGALPMNIMNNYNANQMNQGYLDYLKGKGGMI